MSYRSGHYSEHTQHHHQHDHGRTPSRRPLASQAAAYAGAGYREGRFIAMAKTRRRSDAGSRRAAAAPVTREPPRPWLAMAAIAAVTLAAYGRVAGYPFIENYDVDGHVPSLGAVAGPVKACPGQLAKDRLRT